MLPNSFEYITWLTTVFLSKYKARVADPSIYHKVMTGTHAKK